MECRRTEFNRIQLDRITKFSFASLPVYKSDLKLATVKQQIVHLYIVLPNVHRKKQRSSRLTPCGFAN